MGGYSPKFRQTIVKEELGELMKKGYISKETYEKIIDAQGQYYTTAANEKALELSNRNQANEQLKLKPVKTIVAPKTPKKEKKVLSQQEIRERNITWALNLGVILLLIGGLVLATSTWDTLQNWMKTGLVGLVALFFFGLAYFSERVLKIEKTAFAFHVLGSLFLPIVIFSIAYFELFGTYFSLTGEGRYLYGAAGTLFILPINLLLSIRLQSRLFVWFSYVTLSVLIGFCIAALYLPIDGFYLGIMLFNGCLVIGYRYLRKHGRYHLFMKEFIGFIQANLILSTLLMLLFYNNELMHSFTLIVTAALYFSMIFVTNQKEYHFVFSAMLVYGAFQLIEFSVINEVSGIAYALLGVIFLALPTFLKDQASLQKVFRYTGAVVSAGAFIYISFEGLLLKINEPSIVLLIAYVIISLNFIFLSNVVKRRLFNYLGPVFLVAAFYQFVLLVQGIFWNESLIFAMFLMGIFLYIVFGCYLSHKFLKPIKNSSRDVGIAVIGICMLSGFIFLDWVMLGTMFLLLSALTLFMYKFEDRKTIKESKISTWVHGIALGLAVVLYYGELIGNKYYYVGSSGAEHLAVGSLVVLLASYIWQHFKYEELSRHSFFVANIFYAYGILQTFSFNYDPLVRTLIIFGGIGMAYLLYQRTKWVATPYVVSGISLLFYLTGLHAIDTLFQIESDLYNVPKFVLGAVLLLTVGLFIENNDPKLTNGFWWVGHIYMPFALLYSYWFYEEKAMWAFVVAVIIYGISLLKVTQPLFIKIFLYACLTSFWLVIHLSFMLFEWKQYSHYSFLSTSAVIAVFWIMSKGSWQRLIAYYLVPFSIIGLVVFQLVIPYELDTFIATFLYAAGLLVIMHKEKWDLYNVIPLCLTFYAIGIYQYELWTVTLFAVILTGIGYVIYHTIYKQENKRVVIDWYTIVGFFAMLTLFNLSEEALWTKLLPGLLIAVNIWLQRNRITYVPAKWMVFIASASLLQPYYTVLGNISIPTLIERELYVLPWIVLVIVLKKVTNPEHRKIANDIQWAVLIIVSLLLIQDGLASSTIYDALILGTLSLLAMLAGMFYQVKSFFFVGAGVLLLNVFLQTRPYWGNMPWWAYLLIAGSILIAVASYNEYHKQKIADDKETLVTVFKAKIIDHIKGWD